MQVINFDTEHFKKTVIENVGEMTFQEGKRDGVGELYTVIIIPNILFVCLYICLYDWECTYVSVFMLQLNILTPHHWYALHSIFLFNAAFDRTGRIINITVAPINNYDPPRLLNYLTAPHVCVWSAACASCAVPGLFDSITLMIKGKNL